MKNCEQTKGQSVLEHGLSVQDYLFDLLSHLSSSTPLKHRWKLPDWLCGNEEFILNSMPDYDTLSLYTKYHDCGKPFCVTVDDEGKRHFPNHAEVSYTIFKQFFNNEVAAELILHDMDVHLLKSDGVEEFCKFEYAVTLLVVGLSEIHSNAQMFGGIDSTSFKIKWKNINQRGKQIINNLKNKNQQ